MKFQEFYEAEEKFDQLIKEADEMKELDQQFVNRFVDFLEKIFPGYGKVDQAIDVELRKIIQVGDGKEVKKIKKKIHDTLQKAKQKFLMFMQSRTEKIQAVPKGVPKEVPGEGKPAETDVQPDAKESPDASGEPTEVPKEEERKTDYRFREDR